MSKDSWQWFFGLNKNSNLKKPKTTWEKIKFYFGRCPYDNGKIKRWSWTKAYCDKCNETWEVEGL